jgi:Tfp pilus assembly protein PilX
MIGKSIWDYNDNCNGGLCTNGNAPAPLGYDWTAGTKHVTIDKSATSAKVSSELSENPRYFNEYAGMIKSSKCSGGWCPVYRVTGHTTGNNNATVVILQQVERQ